MKLDNPYTLIVSGQTGSGKTYFIERLIANQVEMHERPFDRIILAYAIFQPAYMKMMQNFPGLELFEGFPDEALEDILASDKNQQTMLILDDLMIDLESDKRLPSLFTRMRHKQVSTIFVVQNFYFKSKYMTTVSRNAQYLTIFPNPRDASMILSLGRQMFPLKPGFLPDAFNQATSTNYGYLFIDSKPTTPAKFRVRDRIFPGEISRVYVAK